MRWSLALLLACGGATRAVESTEPPQQRTETVIAEPEPEVEHANPEDDPAPPSVGYCPVLPPAEAAPVRLVSERPYLVHARVVRASEERGRHDGRSVRYHIRIVEVLDYIFGTEATVHESYQRRFPLYERIDPRHPARIPLQDLERGREYVLAVELPGEGPTTTPDDLPRGLGRRFGPYAVPLVNVLPIERLEEVVAAEQAASEARVGALANSRRLVFAHRLSSPPIGDDAESKSRASADAARDFVRAHFSERLRVALTFEPPTIRAVPEGVQFDYAFSAAHEGESLPAGRLDVRTDLDGTFDSYRVLWQGSSRWDERSSFEQASLSDLVERDLGIHVHGGNVTHEAHDDGLTEPEVRTGGAIEIQGRRPRFQHHIEARVTPRCYAILEFHTRY